MGLENFAIQNNSKKESKLEILQNKLKELGKEADRLGYEIDRGIKETVALLNLLNFPTSASCEGHIDRGIPVPWIDIEAENKPE